VLATALNVHVPNTTSSIAIPRETNHLYSNERKKKKI